MPLLRVTANHGPCGPREPPGGLHPGPRALPPVRALTPHTPGARLPHLPFPGVFLTYLCPSLGLSTLEFTAALVGGLRVCPLKHCPLQGSFAAALNLVRGGGGHAGHCCRRRAPEAFGKCQGPRLTLAPVDHTLGGWGELRKALSGMSLRPGGRPMDRGHPRGFHVDYWPRVPSCFHISTIIPSLWASLRVEPQTGPGLAQLSWLLLASLSPPSLFLSLSVSVTLNSSPWPPPKASPASRTHGWRGGGRNTQPPWKSSPWADSPVTSCPRQSRSSQGPHALVPRNGEQGGAGLLTHRCPHRDLGLAMQQPRVRRRRAESCRWTWWQRCVARSGFLRPIPTGRAPWNPAPWFGSAAPAGVPGRRAELGLYPTGTEGVWVPPPALMSQVGSAAPGRSHRDAVKS